MNAGWAAETPRAGWDTEPVSFMHFFGDLVIVKHGPWLLMFAFQEHSFWGQTDPDSEQNTNFWVSVCASAKWG